MSAAGTYDADVKPHPEHCGHANMLWLVVLALLLCFAAAMSAGGWFFLIGRFEQGVAATLVAAYCVLFLIGLALSAVLLRVAACCSPQLYQADCKAPPKEADRAHGIKD